MFGNPAELAGRFADGEPNGFLAETGMNSVFMQIMNIPLDLEKLYAEAQEVYLRQHRAKTAHGFAAHLLAYFPPYCPKIP